ncbi:hypothetical protein KOR34_08250 [Posidoniimonas corsicana]|uniref:Carboxypeptidase regulatory-like domain-containing protein n=1 Tax=Posidoniimonas corsicana TaxID=1938618 RepID=A0A5C5VBJ6_9BACT|nr:hypothetical protein KOR34_08250 [Posidoniimonas corsicana]
MSKVSNGVASRALTLLLTAAVGLAVGCGGGGGKTAKVAGQVTIGGKPLPADAQGTVSFAKADDIEATPAVAPIQNGRYEAANAPTGTVQVVFDIYTEGPPKVSQRTGEEYRERTSLVPAQQAAGQQVTIDGDNESLDFNL